MFAVAEESSGFGGVHGLGGGVGVVTAYDLENGVGEYETLIDDEGVRVDGVADIVPG